MQFRFDEDSHSIANDFDIRLSPLAIDTAWCRIGRPKTEFKIMFTERLLSQTVGERHGMWIARCKSAKQMSQVWLTGQVFQCAEDVCRQNVFFPGGEKRSQSFLRIQTFQIQLFKIAELSADFGD
ncbi:MAG: hypothetical protein F9B45_30835 [Phycisphaera sp. RhM]|nr:hypothetical protein [Phycisphaera sp. RhM]